MRALGLRAEAVDHGNGPPEGGDLENCRWCQANEAILVTNDRGKRDRAIIDALAQCKVGGIFVYDDLRNGPAHRLARALLAAEAQIDEMVRRNRHIGHRLRPSGKLEPRGKA